MYKIDVRRHPVGQFSTPCLRPAVFYRHMPGSQTKFQSEIYRIVHISVEFNHGHSRATSFLISRERLLSSKRTRPASLRFNNPPHRRERMRCCHPSPHTLSSQVEGGTSDPTPPLDISTWRRVLMLRCASLSSPCAHCRDVGRETLFVGAISPRCQLDESV